MIFLFLRLGFWTTDSLLTHPGPCVTEFLRGAPLPDASTEGEACEDADAAIAVLHCHKTAKSFSSGRKINV